LATGGPLSALARLLSLVEICPACRDASGAGFCGACRAEFRLIDSPCRVCGLPSPGAACPGHASAWQVDRTSAPYEYAEPLDHYLQALKFSRGRALGRALGLLLVDSLRTGRDSDLGVDALVPLPLSPRRLRERGYNQAVEIARTLASELRLPLAIAGVSRPVDAEAQSRLGARARKANVADAFRVDARLRGRRLAIVDDVITTGATVNALAAALRAAGAARVEAVAVARTVRPTRDQSASMPPDALNR
jgi:ComF family protein